MTNNSTSRKTFSWVYVILILFIAGLSWGVYLFHEHWKEKQREDLMWMARGQLELMTGDTSVEFLRLGANSYSGNTLHLLFHSVWPYHNLINVSEEHDYLQPSFVKTHSLLMAFACISPESWDTACKYLDEAEVNLHVKYQYLDTLVDTEPISPDTLKMLLTTEKSKRIGLSLYAAYKGQETLNYARRHFRRDIAFTADSIKMEDKYVALHLSYDDRYSIEHFLDTTHVNAHFTDDVGEMGSILDNMLEICVHTERGFAFVYTGKKKHAVNRLQWEYSQLEDYIDAKVIRGLRNDERHFNSVHTYIERRN